MKMMSSALARAEPVVPLRAVSLADLPELMQTARAGGFRQAESLAQATFRAFDPMALALRLDPPAAAAVPPACPAAAPPVESLPDIPPPAPPPDPPPDPLPRPDGAADLAGARAAAHAAGLAEGIARGRQDADAEWQARMDAALHLLASAHDRLVRPSASDTAALGQTLLEAVRRLSAERAGRLIDEDPQPFLARIERLAERIAQASAGLELRLNPADLALIWPHLAQSALLADARLTPAADLARGDIDLRLPGVHLADLLFPQPGEAA